MLQPTPKTTKLLCTGHQTARQIPFQYKKAELCSVAEGQHEKQQNNKI
jgi:hypothetical protein